MKRAQLLLAAVLIVTAVMVMRRGDVARAPRTPPCEGEGACVVPGPAVEPAPESSPPGPPPGASEAPMPARSSQAPPKAALDPVTLRAEADRLIRQGEVEEGVKVFRKAVAADPSAKNHGDFGSLLYRLTAFDEAARHLKAAAELEPHDADRWIALANAYYRKIDLGEAWKAERKAREAEPGLELGRDRDGMRVRKTP